MEVETSTGDVGDEDDTDDDCEPLLLEVSAPNTDEVVDAEVRLFDESDT